VVVSSDWCHSFGRSDVVDEVGWIPVYSLADREDSFPAPLRDVIACQTIRMMFMGIGGVILSKSTVSRYLTRPGSVSTVPYGCWLLCNIPLVRSPWPEDGLSADLY